MNIEEERKAFKQHTTLDSNVYNHEFKFWLTAKAHAKEMAKPTVKIMSSMHESAPYPYIISLFDGETFNGVLEGFTNDEDAETWACNNGYRVIE